jgi:imidazolonepropionase
MRCLISPCTQLLTLAGKPLPRRASEQQELSLIEDGAVLIDGETILAVGSASELASRCNDPNVSVISAQGCVVMPGFVDSHAHPVFLRSRQHDYELRIAGHTYGEIAALGGGIMSSARDVRSSSEEELADVSLSRLRLFLEHGTTTLEAKSGYGLNFENEMKLLKVIQLLQQRCELELVPTLLAHEVPEEFRSQRLSYLRMLRDELIPQVAQRQLADFCDCFAEPGHFSLEEAESILRTARDYGLKLKLHADQLSRSGAAVMGSKLGAVSLDHLEQITEEDILKLSGTASIATLLPGSVFHLGLSAYPPARTLIDAGVPVALATDFNPGTSPTVSMQMILTLACTQMKMTPAEAIVAATINGAHALQRGDRVGSLEPGKQADLIVMDVEDFRLIPYWFGVNHCRMTIKKGTVVYTKRL